MKSQRAKLRKKFPKLREFEKEMEKYKTKREFADALGVCVTTIYEHRKWLIKGKKVFVPRGVHHYMTDAELDENIRKVVESAGVVGVGEVHQWMGKVKI